MTARDFQRSKVYAAENKIPSGRAFNTVAEMQEYCNRMINSKWWQRLHPNIRAIVVKDGRGRTRAIGYRSGNTINVSIPRHARTELILIHEVAHGLKKRGEPGHGKEYCGEYVRLVRHFMGIKSGKDLQDSFDIHGVLYTELPRSGNNGKSS